VRSFLVSGEKKKRPLCRKNQKESFLIRNVRVPVARAQISPELTQTSCGQATPLRSLKQPRILFDTDKDDSNKEQVAWRMPKISGKHAVATTYIGNVYTTKHEGNGKFEPFVFVDTGDVAMACVGMLNSGEIFGFGASDLKDPKSESALQFIPSRAETEMPKGALLPKLHLHAKVASGNDRCLTMAFDKNKKALAYQMVPNKVKVLEFGRISKFKKNGEVADIAANQTHTCVLKTDGHVLASENGMTWIGSSADDEYLLSNIVAGDGFVVGPSKLDPTRMILMIHDKPAGTTKAMSVDFSIPIINIVDTNAFGKFVSFVANIENDKKGVAASKAQAVDDGSTVE
jgi:hypothetical protein